MAALKRKTPDVSETSSQTKKKQKFCDETGKEVTEEEATKGHKTVARLSAMLIEAEERKTTVLRLQIRRLMNLLRHKLQYHLQNVYPLAVAVLKDGKYIRCLDNPSPKTVIIVPKVTADVTTGVYTRMIYGQACTTNDLCDSDWVDDGEWSINDEPLEAEVMIGKTRCDTTLLQEELADKEPIKRKDVDVADEEDGEREKRFNGSITKRVVVLSWKPIEKKKSSKIK